LTSNLLAEPVLVGRERELEELQKYLNSAFEGKGKTVFVSAEAGIGKTRLIHEFLDSARREKNITVLTGWCLLNAGVPYFPFIEAFTSYYSSLGDKSETEELELNSWLKEPPKPNLTGKLEYLSPQALKDQTFVAFSKTIHSIASQGLVILFIDDIHWADSASLALIHYLARAVNNSEKVLVLATFRTEELTSDFEGYPHQLVQTLSMMRREDLFIEIKLSGLNQACVSKMAESMLGGSLQQGLAEKLAIKSEGNPLFVVESLRMLHEQEDLVQENNEWHLAVEEIEIPSKMRDIIIQRLARLNKAQRRNLDAASVIGDEFEVGLLSAVLDQDSLDVLETLNAVAQSSAIICVDEDRLRFDHARSREVIYEAIAKPLRQGYHNRVAEKLEGSRSATLPLSDLAYHYEQAGNKKKAVKYALAAGQNELARWSNAEAIRHFTYVLQIVGQDSELAEDRTSALEGLGDAFYASSMFQKATKTFEELGDTAEVSVVKLRAFRKAVESAFQQGDPLCMLGLVKKAEPYAAANRLENARVLHCRSRAHLLQMNPSYIKDLEDALQVFEEEYSLWDVAWALMGAGNFHVAWQGKEHQGLAEALRSVALFDELGDFNSQMETLFILGFDFIVCQLYSEALDVYAKIIAINEKMKMGDYLHACNAYAWAGVLFSFYENDLEKGLSYNLKALELSRKTDSPVTQGVVYSNLVRAYALLGDVAHAEEYFEKLLELPQAIFNFTTVNGEFTKAVFLAAKGQWKIFEELFEKLKGSHVPGWSQSAEWYYAWVLERQGRFEEARAQREKLKKNRREAEERFEHVSIQASFMVRRHGTVGEEVEMRLDIVNVAHNPGMLTKVEGLMPLGSKIVSFPSFCSIANSTINMNHKKINSFQVETIKLKSIFTKAGVYELEPCLFYVNDLNGTTACKIKPITLTLQFSPSEYKMKESVGLSEGRLNFKSEAAEKAFNFLVKAFEEDYTTRRITLEKCGWRTLMEIARNAQITTYSMYGRYRRGGEALSELGRLGIVESRFFLGERGRSGRVLKIRIAYEKEYVRKPLHNEPKNKSKEKLPN